MQTQTHSECVWERVCVNLLLQDTHVLLFTFSFFFFYLMGEEKDRGEGGAAQVLQSSCLTSRDLLTNSTCCCLPILLQPPGLLLTGASCEWDAAAFRVDPYMCEINHFTRPKPLSRRRKRKAFLSAVLRCSVLFPTHSLSASVNPFLIAGEKNY